MNYDYFFAKTYEVQSFENQHANFVGLSPSTHLWINIK